MRLNETLGSFFESFPEPSETYREKCFSYQKWIFSTGSEDVKWIVIRREFLTLNEQVMEWIDKFNFPETIKLDAKRLIWDIKYDDYITNGFRSPIVIALSSLKIIHDMRNLNFFLNFNNCVSVIRDNTRGRKILLQHNLNVDRSTKERIKMQSNRLLNLIGSKRTDEIKKMWGCIDEANLLA